MRVTLVLLMLSVMAVPVYAGWQDLLDSWLGGGESSSEPASSTGDAAAYTPTRADMNRAILDALEVGVKRAIDLLGRPDGYLADAQVRIPMPEDLQKIEQLLRKLGQDKYADRFITSMNRAAEQAVPQTTQIFVDAIGNIRLEDAQAILQGSDDAATSYFRKQTSSKLEKVIRPLVADAMNQTGVTRHYKNFVARADFLEPYVAAETLDLDAYVTRQTINGLFIKLAEEERLIRKNPAARSSELLKQVFGYFQGRP